MRRILRGRAGGVPVRFVGDLSIHTPHPGDPQPEPVLTTGDGQSGLVMVRTGDGSCVRWLGDLARSVQYLRQGNPNLADQDSNGRGGVQPQDLFAGMIAPEDFRYPSADHLVEKSLALLAIPFRLHPMPPQAKGLVIYTADQDYVPAAGVLAQSEDAAVPMTWLLTDSQVGSKPDVDFGTYSEPALAEQTLDAVRRWGSGAGVHPNLVALSADQMRSVVVEHIRRFRERIRQIPRVVRNHHLVWKGYTEMAAIHAEAGLTLNLDYMALAFRGEGALGFLNASGYAAAFAANNGHVLPILQQGTQIDDHVLLPERFQYDGMDAEKLSRFAEQLIANANGQDPVPITVNHHPVWWYKTGGQVQARILAAARGAGSLIWSADRWLAHLQAVRTTVVDYDETTGILTVQSGDSDTALLLSQEGSHRGSRVLGGRTYQVVAVPAGIVHTENISR